MSDPECFIKLDRAFDHLEVVEEIAGEWVKTYRVTHDPNPDEKDARIVHLRASPAPIELGLLIGECLHNARSFLDNLAFHLASVHSQANFSEAMRHTSEFPIFFDRVPADKEFDKKIGGVHPDAKDVIKALQPHHATDYRQDRLFQLHELDRINKHRFLLPSAGARLATGVGLPGYITHIDYLINGGKAVVGPSGYAEIARYLGSHTIGGGKEVMRVPLHVESGAVFTTKPFWGISITTVLKGVLEHIRDEIAVHLRPFF